MRDRLPEWFERYRAIHPFFGSSPVGAMHGAFAYEEFQVISSGSGPGETPHSRWEHVSISRRDRCPTWEEMSAIKDVFWKETETVLQFHPKKSKYVNIMPNCLHLWRKRGVNHELPPADAI